MIEALCLVFVVACAWGFSSLRAAILRGPDIISDDELARRRYKANGDEYYRKHQRGYYNDPGGDNEP